MGSRKGSNGQIEGRANVRTLLACLREIDDFRRYIDDGALNKSKLAKEAGLDRGVMYSNTRIKDWVLPALTRRLERRDILRPRAANPVEVMQRAARSSEISAARVKQIQEQNESLMAERDALRKQVEELKKKLTRLGRLEAQLYSSGRLPW
jgi:multidrug resistance efflux pump